MTPSSWRSAIGCPHKGFETLLEALARIDPNERPHLTITGSHGEDPLAPTVERLGLRDAVDLRGWLGSDELERLYAESTALVFPTRFEGFGLPRSRRWHADVP